LYLTVALRAMPSVLLRLSQPLYQPLSLLQPQQYFTAPAEIIGYLTQIAILIVVSSAIAIMSTIAPLAL
jgi:hypothetical protein